MTSLAVRQARASDADQVVRLGEYMYSSVGASVDEQWRDFARGQVASRLGNDLFGWVIESDTENDVLVACAFANLNARLPLPHARGQWRAYVQWVSVDQGHQRQGLATLLMSAVEQWAESRSVEVIELVSSPAGRPLYTSLGYVLAPDVHYPADVRGVPMRKTIARGAVGH